MPQQHSNRDPTTPKQKDKRQVDAPRHSCTTCGARVPNEAQQRIGTLLPCHKG